MSKLNKKTLISHGCIIAAMIIACCFNIQFIFLWNLGYAVFFMGYLIVRWTRDLRPQFLKVLAIILLMIGSAPWVSLMCLPSWFLCVVYSINNPEYGIDLPSYNGRGVEIHHASFYRDYNSYFYEGEIDEDSLKKAAILQGWQFQEITKPINIYDTAGTRIKKHLDNSYQHNGVVVENGLVYNGYAEGSDCGEFVVYDSRKHRLYFLSTLR